MEEEARPFRLAITVCPGEDDRYLTNYLVVGQRIHARCPFDLGLVFNDLKPNRFSQWNGRPLSFLQNAQLFAVNNSCEYGIYKQVNSVTSFCPDNTDIIGSWKSGTANVTIVNDLYERGALYDIHFFEQSTTTNLLGSSFNHLVAWSTSASEDSDGTDWDVLVAVQTNWQRDQPVQMDTLKCTLDAPGARNTRQKMASLYNLRHWVATFQSLMYYGTNTPAVNNVTDELAMLLNTMVMISGGGNYLLAKPLAGGDRTQGCIKVVAYVPLVMIGLFSFVGGLFLASIPLFLLSLSWLRRVRSGLGERVVNELDTIPQDVLEWAVLAAWGQSVDADQLEMVGMGAVPDHGHLYDLLLIGHEGAVSSARELVHGGMQGGVPIVEARELRNFKIGFSRPIQAGRLGEGATQGRIRIFEDN
ncbi:hypothetical protein EDB81DRAFT_844386 [Dactylonectria macrodidyma]|uniref:Uncharacterized protein n=1 Tax=Dactylonectria macrodidyma TaxID=307937 RepID=A0A9P9EF74_9HYPO|nr:hypothetical protein EDB81DRAFT_844386 [Dactylonectria macrodidyma]